MQLIMRKINTLDGPILDKTFEAWAIDLWAERPTIWFAGYIEKLKAANIKVQTKPHNPQFTYGIKKIKK